MTNIVVRDSREEIPISTVEASGGESGVYIAQKAIEGVSIQDEEQVSELDIPNEMLTQEAKKNEVNEAKIAQLKKKLDDAKAEFAEKIQMLEEYIARLEQNQNPDSSSAIETEPEEITIVSPNEIPSAESNNEGENNAIIDEFIRNEVKLDYKEIKKKYRNNKVLSSALLNVKQTRSSGRGSEIESIKKIKKSLKNNPSLLHKSEAEISQDQEKTSEQQEQLVENIENEAREVVNTKLKEAQPPTIEEYLKGMDYREKWAAKSILEGASKKKIAREFKKNNPDQDWRDITHPDDPIMQTVIAYHQMKIDKESQVDILKAAKDELELSDKAGTRAITKKQWLAQHPNVVLAMKVGVGAVVGAAAIATIAPTGLAAVAGAGLGVKFAKSYGILQAKDVMNLEKEVGYKQNIMARGILKGLEKTQKTKFGNKLVTPLMKHLKSQQEKTERKKEAEKEGLDQYEASRIDAKYKRLGILKTATAMTAFGVIAGFVASEFSEITAHAMSDIDLDLSDIAVDNVGNNSLFDSIVENSDDSLLDSESIANVDISDFNEPELVNIDGVENMEFVTGENGLAGFNDVDGNFIEFTRENAFSFGENDGFRIDTDGSGTFDAVIMENAEGEFGLYRVGEILPSGDRLHMITFDQAGDPALDYDAKPLPNNVGRGLNGEFADNEANRVLYEEMIANGNSPEAVAYFIDLVDSMGSNQESLILDAYLTGGLDNYIANNPDFVEVIRAAGIVDGRVDSLEEFNMLADHLKMPENEIYLIDFTNAYVNEFITRVDMVEFTSIDASGNSVSTWIDPQGNNGLGELRIDENVIHDGTQLRFYELDDDGNWMPLHQDELIMKVFGPNVDPSTFSVRTQCSGS